MKRILMTLCAAAITTGLFAQSYDNLYDEGPEGGDVALGMNVQVGFGSPTNIGLGGKFQLYAAEAFRVELNGNYYMKATENLNYVDNDITQWDLNLNFHYLFNVAEKMHVYPILGAGYMNWKKDYLTKDIKRDDTGAPILDANGNQTYTDPYSTTSHLNRVMLNIGAGYAYDINDNFQAMGELQYHYTELKTNWPNTRRFTITLGVAYRF